MTPSAPSRGKQREATRTRLLRAVSAQVRTSGVESLNLAEVAAAAGMSRSAVYNHFPDKDSLLAAYAEWEMAAYVADLEKVLGEVSDPVARLRAYVRHQLTYLSGSHGALALVPGMRSDPAYQRLLGHAGAVEATLREILAEGAAERWLAPDAEAMLGLVMACTTQGGLDSAGDLEDHIDATQVFVLRALGARLGRDGRARRRPPG